MSSALHEWDRIIWPKTTIDFLSQKIGSEIIAPTTYLVLLQLFCAKTSKKFEVWFRSMITSFKNSCPSNGGYCISHISMHFLLAIIHYLLLLMKIRRKNIYIYQRFSYLWCRFAEILLLYEENWDLGFLQNKI